MEGFYTVSSPQSRNGPGIWALCQGIDFEQVHSIPGIDYATAHYYPVQKGWDWQNQRPCDKQCKFEWVLQYAQTHVSNAKKIGKPFVIEEFGVSLYKTYVDEKERSIFYTENDRLTFYKEILGFFTAQIDELDAAGGAIFWTAATQGYLNDGYTIYLDTPSKPFSPSNFSIVPLPETQEFHLRSMEQACKNQENSISWKPNQIFPVPYKKLEGQNEVEVIQSTVIELQKGAIWRI
eukprot:TRINITY_DN10902_c0_g1_i3.p1 TRINITY_DN10902_c0_g1~~TRINITY_DN10902_c0_g1_i3.p1  ORF type:complete len:235 (+),score=25.16 TRINITY_DN10902_c0_g1_i3:1-705(+)